MKKIVCCFLFVITFTACNSQDEMTDVTIHYNAYTRGSSLDVTITQNSIIYKDSSGEKAIAKKKLFWQKLNSYIENIELESITSFLPPSNDRISDKALHATLLIVKGGDKFTSKTFDHGNPPKELKPLLDFLFKELEIH